MQDLIVTTAEGIATLTIHRPEKRNAMNADLVSRLAEFAAAADEDPGVRGIIVTGSGGKAFAAGADIDEVRQLNGDSAVLFSLDGQRALSRIERCGKPVVAAIQGFALGAGLELAMACHFRIVTPGSKLGLPEGRLGILPGYGGTQRLPLLVGRSWALKMLLTGEPVDADTALRIGLVDEIADPAELLQACASLLRRTWHNGPLANAAMLDLVRASLDAGLRREAEVFGRIRATRDCDEGLAAFAEKRNPLFRNH